MNIEEEGGGIFNKLKKATPNPLKAAKSGFGKLKDKASGLKDKVKGKLSGIKDKAKQAAMMGTAAALLGSAGLGASKLGKLGKFGTSSSVSATGSRSSTQIPILQLFLIIAVTGVLGAFAALSINKSQNFNDSILKWGILMLVLIIPVIIAYMKKSETLDLLLNTIIASEVNIICIYAILAFTAYSVLVKSPSLDTFNDMKLNDKIGIIVGLLIPLCIIAYNFFKVSKMDAIVITVFAVAAAAILLSPQWIK